MTEIFRGKRADNGEWVEGYYIAVEKTHFIISSYPSYEKYLVEPSTICQYIGRTDKNNRKIFDGDIVETKYGRVCKIIHLLSDRFLGWDLVPIETKHPAPDEYDLWYPDNLEVVGNIFDNPEPIVLTKPLTHEEAQDILREAKHLVERVELCYGKNGIIGIQSNCKLVSKMIMVENHIEQLRSDLEGAAHDKPA